MTWMRYRRYPPTRPPWWPEDESWPPTGPPNVRVWRRMRGRLFLRLAIILILLFFVIFGACTILFWLAVTSLGLIQDPLHWPFFPEAFRQPGFFRFWWIVPIVFVVLAVTGMTNALRRAAIPFGDVMEAAGRVASGDYAARVSERGPREMRAMTHAFNEMAAQLQRNDEQRRNLLADVTHELRTPLTVIQGNLEGLLDGVYPRDDLHLAPILEETRVLSRLIDDLRTLSLAETGALKLQREPADLVAIVNESVSSFRSQAAKSEVDMTTSAPPDLPLVEVDSARIREVLDNLISNALRFSHRGGQIHVVLDEVRVKRQVEISVKDGGAGIPDQDLPHIFDRFYKSQESRGMGLGLAIAKGLVAAHGGQIFADSKSGHGTTIRFTLPMTPS